MKVVILSPEGRGLGEGAFADYFLFFLFATIRVIALRITNAIGGLFVP
jgi:hypothetical protein